MKKINFVFVCLLLAACSSKPPSPSRERAPEPEARRSNPAPVAAPKISVESLEENIDYIGLQRDLGLDRGDEDLGLREKMFNTCQAGFGYSRSNNCRSQYFVSVNLRLLCRPTEGTDSTILTAADLQPITNQNITWHFKNLSGSAHTDSQGYFQVRTAVPRSQKNERLRITLGDDFLVMRTGEMSRLVTPKSWCSP